MNDLFSKDKINTDCQIELDIAKSFSTNIHDFYS